jgi:hypothetical protein
LTKAEGHDEKGIRVDHIISDVRKLSLDPDNWYNNCAEMYYGIKAIYADLPGW